MMQPSAATTTPHKQHLPPPGRHQSSTWCSGGLAYSKSKPRRIEKSRLAAAVHLRLNLPSTRSPQPSPKQSKRTKSGSCSTTSHPLPKLCFRTVGLPAFDHTAKSNPVSLWGLGDAQNRDVVVELATGAMTLVMGACNSESGGVCADTRSPPAVPAGGADGVQRRGYFE
jgi:hypothetical protein